MEGTGVYWKPVWYELCQDFNLILANPAHMKVIPRHKTDKRDAFWIAKLTRISLLPKSFVPDKTIQEVRDLTRQRKHFVETRSKEVNRVHKILQLAGIKLTTCIEDMMGSSSHNLMGLLSVKVQRLMAKESIRLSIRVLRRKVPDLLKALDGHFSEPHRFMLKQALLLNDFVN